MSTTPKFKIGDMIVKKRTGAVHEIIECIWNPSTVTHVARVDMNAQEVSSFTPTTMKGFYSYKINDGKSWSHEESTLHLLARKYEVDKYSQAHWRKNLSKEAGD